MGFRPDRLPAHGRRAARWTAVLVLGTSIAACGFPDRQGATASIAAAVRALPGVSATSVNYQNDFTGGAHFYLWVTLADDASSPEAASVGREFVERVKAADFAHYDVELDVEYRMPDDLMVRSLKGSLASISYSFDEDATVGPSGGEVADSLARWLRIAQDRSVWGVRLQRPLFGAAGSAAPGLTVALAPSADDRAVTALIDAEPALRGASWQLVAGPDTAAEIYTVRGVFPDQQRRRQWERIVATLGQDGRVEASTDTVDLPAGRPATRVEATVSSQSRDPAEVVRALAAELPPLGLPVWARFFIDRQALTVTLGGCDRDAPPGEPGPPSALQTELRQRYQRC